MPWRWLALVACLLAWAITPWPRGCDPRAEELPMARYAELARFSDLRTRREIEAALEVVDPEGRLRPYLTLDDGALAVRLDPRDRTPAVRIALRATALPPDPWRPRRVVLDPGHFGGAWSQAEQRHVRRAEEPPVREGDLTWATVRLIERQLRQAGFEVLLTRGPPPSAPYPAALDEGFDPSLEAALQLGEQQLAPPRWPAPLWPVGLWQERRRLARERPFPLYSHFDLRRRAAVAESFAADLTLSIHYDFTRTDDNGILVFVPGAFVGDELATASQRFWALRRILDGNLPRARQLATTMAAAMMRRMALPALTAHHDVETGTAWRPIDPARGVYARNLAVLRRAPGVALLLEGPCVNQSREYQRLQETQLVVDGRRTPARVGEYAAAVEEVVEALR
jgi:N-acetylmuramoyl-L-alanine amidase